MESIPGYNSAQNYIKDNMAEEEKKEASYGLNQNRLVLGQQPF